MELSTNFTLAEMTRSETAARKGIDNTPSLAVIENLSLLCNNLLEPIRSLVRETYGEDKVVVVTSGYRSPKLNKAIGGAPNSQHIQGQAADIHVPGLTIEELFKFIVANFDFDQCIQEFNSWVHVSTVNRKQALRAVKVEGSTKYNKA